MLIDSKLAVIFFKKVTLNANKVECDLFELRLLKQNALYAI